MATSYRGLILAGRYRLEERLSSNPDGEVWRSLDSTLDRKVSIRLMRAGHPFAADVADAARRAALIDDSRLVRVLDVGSDSDSGFVVSEYLDGDSLATLVERSPLSAPPVRRIIGEVAEGLDIAAARGLHHLRLTPRSVIVCRDGTVKISGTAVEAAAAGLEPGHAATASRVDAVALVALLYSGLTGRWPLGDAGFPPAPRGEGGSPVPPADLVPAVPNDLDTLCVVTLGVQDDGPRSPAELVAELQPWQSAEEAPLRAAPRRVPGDAPVTPNPALTMRGRMTSTKRAAANQAEVAAKKAEVAAKKSAAASGAETPAATALAPIIPLTAAAPATPSPAVAAPPPPETPATPAVPPASPRRSATLFPTPSVAATGSLPIPTEPATDRPRRMDSLFTQQTVYPARPTEPAAPTAPTGPADNSTAGNWPPTGITPSTGPNGTSSRNGSSLGPATGPLAPWGVGLVGNSGPGGGRPDSTGPFPIIIPSEAPPRGQSRLVIFSVTVVLVLVLVLATFSLRNYFGGGDNKPSTPAPSHPQVSLTPQAPVASAAVTSPPATPSATPSPTAAAPVPVQIAAIRAIDPQGDGDEDTADSPLAVDGDPATFWKSDTYRSAKFGGLKKGVGLAIRLKKSAAVQLVTIDVNGTGGDVEIHTGGGPDLASSTLVGKGSFQNGQVAVRIPNASPAKYVILWFTKLPSVDGDYKVEVSEVRLK